MKHSLIALGVLAALGSPAFAASPTPDQHIADLEARLKVLEDNAQAMRKQADDAMAALQATQAEVQQLKQQQASAASEPAPEPPAPPPANANAFNPAISIILNGQYAHHSLDPDDYVRTGFPLVGDAGPGAAGTVAG